MHQTYPEAYDDQLDQKITRIKHCFQQFNIPELEIFTSPASHYRMRAEFKIWHDNHACSFAMYRPGEYKKPYKIDNFPVGSKQINQLMPILIHELNQCDILKHKLFQVEFLTTLNRDALITLIYHKFLDTEWEKHAQELKDKLQVNLLGRSKKQKIVIGHDFVIEKLHVNNKPYIYQQIESSFTQPNATVCEKMLAWACNVAKPLTGDLVELYCGNGNFTIPLAAQFNRVLATEISKTAVASARYNLTKNNINNVTIVRMSSAEFSEAMQNKRAFRRLKDIDLANLALTTILVDPPRAGLDDSTVNLVQRFDNIIYISCNPETLHSNLMVLHQSHAIQHFALFDQFPYTHHIECGVLLKKRTG